MNLDTNYLYTDEDVSIILSAYITELGSYAPGYTYKLQQVQHECHIFVTPAVDSENISLPIDYFLNKRNWLHSDTYDVLDEVALVINANPEHTVKILIPFNIANLHWNCVEILIRKEKNIFHVTCFSHDPYGRGELDVENIKILHNTILAKFNIKLPSLRFTSEISPFNRRQHPDDHTSCGVIAVRDVVKLICCENVDLLQSLPVGAKALRGEQLKKVVGVFNLLITESSKQALIERLTHVFPVETKIVPVTEFWLNVRRFRPNPLLVESIRSSMDYVVACPPVNSSGDIYHVLSYLILCRAKGWYLPKVCIAYDHPTTTQPQAQRSKKICDALGFSGDAALEDLTGLSKSTQASKREELLRNRLRERKLQPINQKATTVLLVSAYIKYGRKHITDILRRGFLTFDPKVVPPEKLKFLRRLVHNNVAKIKSKIKNNGSTQIRVGEFRGIGARKQSIFSNSNTLHHDNHKLYAE